MSAEQLTARLAGLKRIGPNAWKARCPAHRDRSPSLSVRALDDGRVLVHCFAGCTIEAVLGAVGLEFDALYPPRSSAPDGGGQAARRPYTAAELLHFVDREALIVVIAAADCLQRGPLGAEDLARVVQARQRIAEVVACLPA